MADRIVDILEVIEIDIQNGEIVAAALQLCDFTLDGLHEHGPIRQLRQCIEASHAGDLLVGLLSRGNVTRRGQYQYAIAERSAAKGDFRPKKRTVLALAVPFEDLRLSAKGFADPRDGVLLGIGRHARRERHDVEAYELILGVAEHGAARLVDLQEPAGGRIENEDSIVHGRENRMETVGDFVRQAVTFTRIGNVVGGYQDANLVAILHA